MSSQSRHVSARVPLKRDHLNEKNARPVERAETCSDRSRATCSERVLAAGMLAILCAGCNGPAASVSPANDPGTKVGNLLAFNSLTPPPNPNRPVGERIDCPEIQVDPGNSAVRVATGEGASGVRYQISIGDVARECVRQGDRLAIRVGVETRIALGPAGAPGSYTAPLRILVRRQSDEAVLASKVYRVGGPVSANGQAQFSLVADPLLVPYTTERADVDYEVVMGFGDAPASKRARR